MSYIHPGSVRFEFLANANFPNEVFAKNVSPNVFSLIGREKSEKNNCKNKKSIDQQHIQSKSKVLQPDRKSDIRIWPKWYNCYANVPI